MRKYSPDIVYVEDRAWGEWVSSPETRMVESPHGTWVPLANAKHAMAKYKALSERLQKRIEKLEDELFLLKANG